MHCLSCNSILSDYEASRKDTHGDYLDLCNTCYYPIRKEVELSNNFDLTIIQHEIIEEGYSYEMEN